MVCILFAMKAKGTTKFRDEEKLLVDAALGLVLFAFGLVLVVLGVLGIINNALISSGANTAGSGVRALYLYNLSEVIIGAVVFIAGIAMFKVRV